jgi:hypothetical protein
MPTNFTLLDSLHKLNCVYCTFVKLRALYVPTVPSLPTFFLFVSPSSQGRGIGIEADTASISILASIIFSPMPLHSGLGYPYSGTRLVHVLRYRLGYPYSGTGLDTAWKFYQSGSGRTGRRTGLHSGLFKNCSRGSPGRVPRSSLLADTGCRVAQYMCSVALYGTA